MVDFYHLFKLGTTALRVVKNSKGVYDLAVILKGIWKPMAVMGVSGMAEGAAEEVANKIIEKMFVRLLGEDIGKEYFDALIDEDPNKLVELRERLEKTEE